MKFFSFILFKKQSWIIEFGQESEILIDEISSPLFNSDGMRVELVSNHNWVVGAYVFIYEE